MIATQIKDLQTNVARLQEAMMENCDASDASRMQLDIRHCKEELVASNSNGREFSGTLVDTDIFNFFWLKQPYSSLQNYLGNNFAVEYLL